MYILPIFPITSSKERSGASDTLGVLSNEIAMTYVAVPIFHTHTHSGSFSFVSTPILDEDNGVKFRMNTSEATGKRVIQ